MLLRFKDAFWFGKIKVVIRFIFELLCMILTMKGFLNWMLAYIHGLSNPEIFVTLEASYSFCIVSFSTQLHQEWTLCSHKI